MRFAHFYLRRARRLLPALALVLLFVVVASTLLLSPLGSQQTVARTGRFASFFTANYALYGKPLGYFVDSPVPSPLLHTWSLAVEEQFYLGFPLLVAVCLATRLRRRALGAAILLLSVVSLVAFVLMSRGVHVLPGVGSQESAAFYSPMTRLWEFGVGVLAALWEVRRRVLPGGVADGVAGLGLVGIAVGALHRVPVESNPAGAVLLLPVLGTAAVLVGCATEGTRVGRLLGAGPLCWLGDRSYSWYLWHWPFIVFAVVLVPVHGTAKTLVEVAAVGLALGVAAASYRLVEQRFRYPPADGRPHPWRTTVVLAVTCTVLPAVLFTGIGIAAAHSWGVPGITELRRATSAPYPLDGRGCSDGVPVTAYARCTVGADLPNRPIYLVGDSNAGQYGAGLLVAGRELGRPVVLSSRSGCPPVDVEVMRPGIDRSSCVRDLDAQLGWLATQPPGVVLVSSVNGFIQASDVRLRDPASGRVVSGEAAKQRLWTRGLAHTLSRLTAAGQAVVLVTVTPHPGGQDALGRPNWSPAACPLATLLRGSERCGTSATLAEEDERQARSLAAERDAVTRVPVAVLDLRSRLCPGGVCATYDGIWRYRNGDHLTDAESRLLAPELADAIRRAAPVA